jgi:glycosyltransferase involved in cell wall biosynthesis
MNAAPNIVIFMPAYNTARTIERTYADIPPVYRDQVLLVDNASADNTVEVARRLGIGVIQHDRNRGYGGSQKTGYREALKRGADVIVMLHSDFQYDPTCLPSLIQPILDGQADMMMGTRIAEGQALAGGMPIWKFIANRCLTTLEDMALGQRLTDLHTGYRAYSRELLQNVPWHLNRDDYGFDSEMIFQVIACGFRIGETPVPVRYFEEASSVNLRASIRYGLQTLNVLTRFLLHRLKPNPHFTRIVRGSEVA